MSNNLERDQWGQLKPAHTAMVEEYINSVKNQSTKHYMLTVARDGEEPVRSIIFYTNAIEAVSVYNSYQDWGFAKDFLTVKLYEPNGIVHEKTLKRLSGVESSFMRENYIDIAKVILLIKDFLPEQEYKNFVYDVAYIFAKDNKRFDEKRFFENTKSNINL